MAIIIIRQIEERDAAVVATLANQLGYSSDDSVILQNINLLLSSPDHCAFVAETDKKVVGWIHGFYALRLGSPSFCEIGSIVVDLNYRNYRKRGIGKQLVEQVVNWGKSKNAVKLRVRCSTSRTETHQFYQHLGLKQLKIQLVFEKLL